MEVEQNFNCISLESCRMIIELFEPCDEFRRRGLLGLDGFIRLVKSALFSSLFDPAHGIPLEGISDQIFSGTTTTKNNNEEEQQCE